MSLLSKKSLLRSVSYALEGIIHVLRTQRNMRIHFLIAILVMVFATSLRLTETELAVLFLTIGMVLVAEMINTAVEAVVDMLSPQFSQAARIAKNVSAGAVLIASVCAVLVGLVVFVWRGTGFLPQRDEPLTTPTIAVLIGSVVVVLITLVIKAASGFPRVRGGMPSGHAALAFSLATAVFFLSENGYTVVLAGLIAVLVCQSRIEAGIHSFLEVIAGSILGILTTVLFFRFL